MDTRKTLDKGRILELLADARALRSEYDRTNGRNPDSKYDHRSLYPTDDQLALSLFERQEGVIIISVNHHGTKITAHTNQGCIVNQGEVRSFGNTTGYVLPDFRSGTTVARFASSVCDLVESRTKNGNEALKNLMPSTALNYAITTRRELQKYI